MKKQLAMIAATMALAACGGGGGEESKDLFSLWTRDGDAATFDLTGMKFGSENLINLYGRDGTRCICDVAVVGTQQSGSMAVTGCISIPYNSKRQPTCEAANITANYTNQAAVLTLTSSRGSVTFR